MGFIEQNLFLVAIFAGLTVGVVIFEFRSLTRRYKEISPAHAVRMINRDEPVVVDVREDNEIGGGKISSARHIPATMFDKRMQELEKDKARALLVYCASGMRSTAICRKLTGSGFADVYNLKGGIAAWEQAGLPTQKSGKGDGK